MLPHVTLVIPKTLPVTHPTVPGAPTDVQATMPSSTSIYVSWREPLGGEVVTGFEVFYTPVNSCPDTPGGRGMVEGSRVTQFTLTGLQPFTNYSIYVRANASQGLGPPSMPAVFEMTRAAGKYCDMHNFPCLTRDVCSFLPLCPQLRLVLPRMSVPLSMGPPYWSGGVPQLAETGMGTPFPMWYAMVLVQAPALRWRPLWSPTASPS